MAKVVTLTQADVPSGKTAPAVVKRIVALTKNQAFVGEISDLYARWQDEKAFEAIADYAAPIQLPAGFKLEKMNAKPFGFDFSVDGGPQRYRFMLNNTQVGWSRLPDAVSSRFAFLNAADAAASKVEQKDFGRWYIKPGFAGYNSPANNRAGYVSEAKAIAASEGYAARGAAQRAAQAQEEAAEKAAAATIVTKARGEATDGPELVIGESKRVALATASEDVIKSCMKIMGFDDNRNLSKILYGDVPFDKANRARALAALGKCGVWYATIEGNWIAPDLNDNTVEHAPASAVKAKAKAKVAPKKPVGLVAGAAAEAQWGSAKWHPCTIVGKTATGYVVRWSEPGYAPTPVEGAHVRAVA